MELPTKEHITVLIADDHNLVCLGLKMLLEGDGMEVVGMASTGQQAVQAAQESIPDVILLDLKMPDMDGFVALSIIRATVPHAKIIITTGFADPDHVSQVLSMGASGFVTKEASPDSIIGAVRAVAAGAAVVSSRRPLTQALEDVPQTSHGQTRSLTDDYGLTGQEMVVLHLIGEGFTNQAMAKELKLSVNTVRRHVSSVLGKLNVENRTRAAIWAYKHGLVD